MKVSKPSNGLSILGGAGTSGLSDTMLAGLLSKSSILASTSELDTVANIHFGSALAGAVSVNLRCPPLDSVPGPRCSTTRRALEGSAEEQIGPPERHRLTNPNILKP